MDTTTARSPSRALMALAAGFNRFGWRLYHRLPHEGNAFLSPVSVATALAALERPILSPTGTGPAG
jgi:serine protease inhibitor